MSGFLEFQPKDEKQLTYILNEFKAERFSLDEAIGAIRLIASDNACAPKQVRRGQVVDTTNWGKVMFVKLDFYMGECTAKLKGITHKGTYYPKIEVFEAMGFSVIDS